MFFGIIDKKLIHVIRKILISRAAGVHVKAVFIGYEEGFEVRSVQIFWFLTNLLWFVVNSDFEICGVVIFITFAH